MLSPIIYILYIYWGLQQISVYLTESAYLKSISERKHTVVLMK